MWQMFQNLWKEKKNPSPLPALRCSVWSYLHTTPIYNYLTVRLLCIVTMTTVWVSPPLKPPSAVISSPKSFVIALICILQLSGLAHRKTNQPFLSQLWMVLLFSFYTQSKPQNEKKCTFFTFIQKMLGNNLLYFKVYNEKKIKRTILWSTDSFTFWWRFFIDIFI